MARAVSWLLHLLFFCCNIINWTLADKHLLICYYLQHTCLVLIIFLIRWYSFSVAFTISAPLCDKHGRKHFFMLCFLIILFFSYRVTSFSFYAPRYGSIIVGAILSKLTAKGGPVKTGSDSSGKRRNRRASFSFHGGMQVFLACFFFSNYNSLLEILSSVVL